MKTEIQYRTFDELLDSVKIDMKHLNLEGVIDTQQLIKIAIRVNYELGLKINPSKSRALEIKGGKAKLPPDFHVLNFALICDDTTTVVDVNDDKTYTQGIADGILEGVYLAQQYYLKNFVGTYNTTMDVLPGTNVITHNLNTTNVVVEAYAPDGTMLSFEITIPNGNSIYIISEAPTDISSVKFVIIGAPQTPTSTVPTTDPTTSVNGCQAELAIPPGEGTPQVYYTTNGKLNRAKTLTRLRIEKSKSVSPDCVNLQSTAYQSAYLKNGFIVTNFDEGTIYINYQSLMEDDDGNLLVMDHPLANEYYEYAMKQRIYEDLFFAGEQVTNFLQLVEQRLRAARNNALSFVNTPDFKTMERNWEMNRKAMYHKYYNMFKSYYP